MLTCSDNFYRAAYKISNLDVNNRLGKTFNRKGLILICLNSSHSRKPMMIDTMKVLTESSGHPDPVVIGQAEAGLDDNVAICNGKVAPVPLCTLTLDKKMHTRRGFDKRIKRLSSCILTEIIDRHKRLSVSGVFHFDTRA